MAIAALPAPVEAAPFRAHVRHLLGTGAITEEALALIAGVPPRTIRRLAHGRRPVPARIAPDVARRLLAVGPADLAALAGRHVDATPATRQLRTLRSRGWSPVRLSEEFGIEHWLVESLLDGTAATCSRLVELQLSGGMLALRSGPARVPS